MNRPVSDIERLRLGRDVATEEFATTIDHMSSVKGAVFRLMPAIDLLQGEVRVPGSVVDVDALADEIIKGVALRGALKVPVTGIVVHQRIDDEGYWPPVYATLGYQPESTDILLAESRRIVAIGGRMLRVVMDTSSDRPLSMKFGKLQIVDNEAFQENIETATILANYAAPKEIVLSPMKRLG